MKRSSLGLREFVFSVEVVKGRRVATKTLLLSLARNWYNILFNFFPVNAILWNGFYLKSNLSFLYFFNFFFFACFVIWVSFIYVHNLFVNLFVWFSILKSGFYFHLFVPFFTFWFLQIKFEHPFHFSYWLTVAMHCCNIYRNLLHSFVAFFL